MYVEYQIERKEQKGVKQTTLIQSELTNAISVVTQKHESYFLIQFYFVQSVWGQNMKEQCENIIGYFII